MRTAMLWERFMLENPDFFLSIIKAMVPTVLEEGREKQTLPKFTSLASGGRVQKNRKQ